MTYLGTNIESSINWLTSYLAPLLDALSAIVGGLVEGCHYLLYNIPAYILIPALALLTWYKSGRGTAIFTLVGLWLVCGMGLWEATTQTMAVVFSSICIVLLLGIPLGFWTVYSKQCSQVLCPILDFMRSMPAFVFLIPAILFFGLGTVSAAFATLFFAISPVIRFTRMGIQKIPPEIIEISQSFGATRWQLLFKVQFPLALPTIMKGVNKATMMSLSMTIIAAIISAEGLGEVVLKGITQMKIGLGIEGSIAIIILAVLLDRITRGMTDKRE